MSDRYKGAILSPTAPTVTLQSAGGIYTSSQQLQYQGQGVWPTAANNPINNSLRFRASAGAYLSRTPASAGNRRTWTYSVWLKKTQDISGSNQDLLSAGRPNNPWTGIYLSTGDGVASANTIAISTTAGVSPGTTTTAVFRDPSAWYHIVVAMDTTQATASDRVKLWVNNVLQTFSYTNYPSQNYDTYVNSATSHSIGSLSNGGGGNNLDGYLAEVNLIDGAALTPSSFGTTDAYGIWQPIPYTGAYGTNGFYLPFRLNSTSSFYGSFNGSSQYLTLPTSSAFSMGTGNFTVETFFNATSVSGFYDLLDQWQNASGSYTTGQWQLQIYNGVLSTYVATGSSSYVQLTVPVNAGIWYHAAVVRNGTTLTMYLNGTAVSSATLSSAFGLSAYAFVIGRETRTSSGYFSGQISNTRITNTAVYTANFTPPTSPLTAVSGTQLLTLQNSTIIDNSTNAFSITNSGSVTTTATTDIFAQPALTSDYSGNGNNWTPNNISLAPGSTYDSMKDVPTNTNSNTANYPTLNPLSKSSSSNLSNGNLSWSSSAYNYQGATSTTALPSSGKWYWETVITTAGTATSDDMGIGVQALSFGTAPKDNGGGSGITNGAVIVSRGDSVSRLVVNNSTVQSGTSYSFATNDIIQVAFDADSGKIWFGKNNSYFDASGGTTGNPGSGTNPVGTLIAGSSYLPVWDGYTNTYVIAANFGQRPFAYTPPSGFYPLNTYNLPTPTILAGNQYMDATTYSGNSSTQSITNSGSMKPDMVWIKARNTTYNHGIQDAVRGVGKIIYPNLTNAEDTGSTSLTAFNSNGFGLGNDSWNQSGITYVGWQWRASNAAGVTNTNGSITTTVSANPTAGFSIVTYTGTGSNATIGHGLGVPPKVWFWKNRDASSDWSFNYYFVYNSMRYLFLNTTAAQGDNSSSYWGNPPTSTVNYIGGPDASTNINGQRFVMYAFAEVAGYSSIGSYTGNGSTDGPFIYTGFRPRYVLVKIINTTGNWLVWDSSRDTYNVVDNDLRPNLSNAESTESAMDFLSNGFKLRSTSGGWNGSGNTYIYMAFAENPFKIARAR